MSRHRYRDSFRFRDEDRGPSTGTVVAIVAGALAGLAVGVLVMQRTGGLSGMKSRIARRRGATAPSTPHQYADDFDYAAASDEFEGEEGDVELEERVLEAFRNDPILSERAVDIGSIGEGVIELAGWVEEETEARHAVTLARGVPGVDTVINRIVIGDEEERFADAARRVAEGDPSLTETRWDGQGVGTGRRRQGTSRDVDRHADPRVELEDRWLRENEALRNAADRTEGLAERRRSQKRPPRGDRTGGAPVAPTGVPKGDHVARPIEADRQVARTEATRDTGGEMTDFGSQP